MVQFNDGWEDVHSLPSENIRLRRKMVMKGSLKKKIPFINDRRRDVKVSERKAGLHRSCSTATMDEDITLLRPSVPESENELSTGMAMLDRTLGSLEDRFQTLIDKTAENVGSDDDESLERKSVRMDGLEVYAVVGALTAATSLSTFDNFSGNWEEIYGNGSYLEIALSYTYLIFAALGTISGLHTVLVFSLVTMYGRTALGVRKGAGYNNFLKGCHSQRFRAFKTFLMSAYSFAIQTSILIINKSPQNLRIPVILLLLCSVAYVYDDVESVISAASEMIFSNNLNTSTHQPSKKTKFHALPAQKTDDEDKMKARRSFFAKSSSVRFIFGDGSDDPEPLSDE